MERPNSSLATLAGGRQRPRIVVGARFRSVVAIAILFLISGGAPGLCDETKTSTLRSFTILDIHFHEAAASLVDTASDDLIVAGLGIDNSFAHVVYFYSKSRRPSPLYRSYQPIHISNKLRNWELASHLFKPSWVSTTERVAATDDYDCVVEYPFIYPAQEKLARAMIIMVENPYRHFDPDDSRLLPGPPSVLIKLKLEAIDEEAEKYMFKMAGMRTLDGYYCSAEELRPFIDRFAAEEVERRP